MELHDPVTFFVICGFSLADWKKLLQLTDPSFDSFCSSELHCRAIILTVGFLQGFWSNEKISTNRDLPSIHELDVWCDDDGITVFQSLPHFDSGFRS